jgi:hypothetical protein
MDKKSEKKTDLQNVKKQIEAAAGHEIDIAPEQIISLRWPVGAHDYTDGTVLWRSIIILGQSCVSSTLLDASASSSTGSTGTVTFLLSSAICLPLVRSLAAPINLQATVRATAPSFLTMTYSLVPDPNSPQSYNDLQITVDTWDANGNPAPNVVFDWRCRLVSNQIIL